MEELLQLASELASLFAGASSPSAHCTQLLSVLTHNAAFVSLSVAIDSQAPEPLVLQTCLTLGGGEPSADTVLLTEGREAETPDEHSRRLLATAVMRAGKGVVIQGAERRLQRFRDIGRLAQENRCAAAVCLPLCSPSGPAFGALTAGYAQLTARDAQAIQAAVALARALSAHHHEQLTSQAAEIGRLLFPPPRSGSAPGGDSDWDSDWSDVGVDDADAAAWPDAFSRDIGESTLEAALLPLRRLLRCASAAFSQPAGSHAVLLTFNDAAVERLYAEWSARYMHKLDLVALLLLVVHLATVGFSPTFAWAARHPLWWMAGFLPTLPLLLALPPTTRAWYRRHRQLALAACLVTAAVWQTATANCTLLMGASNFFKRIHWDAPTACFAWHITNLLTFQLRWCFMVPLIFLLYAVNALYLLPMLCADWAPTAVDSCVLTSTLRSACSIFLALLVLRLIELHTRRLFVRGMEQRRTD